ncbi:CLUMA_CG005924, isoform A [Clunio marinus]|uniref:CLUMA_CG005924, isoform A n=1 Tax=Clunio marinus TaxID=568069 RepID=A0A1J1HWD5_9DIPT|nr:CLUMA_CG005924, isoform A [Clunio marinus]
MADEYAKVARGKLKLKCDSEISKKKKKKKNKEKEREMIANTDKSTIEIVQAQDVSTERKLTKAEISFKKMQDKMQKKRILEKASTTHKQQVEKFNEKLDNLTEHFDIPKVSWTK